MQTPSAVVVLLLALCSAGECQTPIEGYSTCPGHDMIQCRVNQHRCTPISFICDGDNDCGDMSDEQPEMCDVWYQPGCGRGYARCHRNGISDCIPMSQYCSLSDPPCLGDVDPRICQMLRDEQLQDITQIVVPGVYWDSQVEHAEALGEEFDVQVNGTLKHADCPDMYTAVKGKCVSIFFPGNVTWGAARSFCKSIGGDLLTLDYNYNFFATLVQQLHEYRVTADFWLGGFKYNDTQPWTWITGTPIETGAPFWATRSKPTCTSRIVDSLIYPNVTHFANQGRCYHYSKAPTDPPHGFCTALTYELFHHMSDEDCLSNKAPLCIHKKGKN